MRGALQHHRNSRYQQQCCSMFLMLALLRPQSLTLRQQELPGLRARPRRGMGQGHLALSAICNLHCSCSGAIHRLLLLCIRLLFRSKADGIYRASLHEDGRTLKKPRKKHHCPQLWAIGADMPFLAAFVARELGMVCIGGELRVPGPRAGSALFLAFAIALVAFSTFSVCFGRLMRWLRLGPWLDASLL